MIISVKIFSTLKSLHKFSAERFKLNKVYSYFIVLFQCLINSTFLKPMITFSILYTYTVNFCF